MKLEQPIRIPIRITQKFRLERFFVPRNIAFLELGFGRKMFTLKSDFLFFCNLWVSIRRMFSMGTKQLKVFRSIISNIAVFVMDNFSIFKIATKELLHYKSVFCNIPLLDGKWMFRKMEIPISPSTLNPSTFPVCSVFSSTTNETTNLISFNHDYIIP